MNATDQTLVHSTGIKVPLEMQNHSMVVRGVIRAITIDPSSGVSAADSATGHVVLYVQ